MKKKITIHMDPETYERFKEIAHEERTSPTRLLLRLAESYAAPQQSPSPSPTPEDK